MKALAICFAEVVPTDSTNGHHFSDFIDKLHCLKATPLETGFYIFLPQRKQLQTVQTIEGMISKHLDHCFQTRVAPLLMIVPLCPRKP